MRTMLPRRRESPRAQPVDQNTSANATVAATSAFLHLQNAKSNSSLSSAAAATALRSLTTSPEPVGNVQTKRMMRRGSASSNGSGTSGRGGGAARPTLQRSNSSGSMTERTFRQPSPSDPSRRPMSMDSGVPPIPPIPNVHQRASSLDQSRRVKSPATQGSDADRISSPPPSSSRRAKRLSNVVEAEDVARSSTPSSPSSPTSPSVNFSRPMSPQSNGTTSAGTGKRYTHGAGSWHTQASTTDAIARPMSADGSYRSAPPPLDLSSIANRPVSKSRSSSGQGSHLARANRRPSHSRSVSGSTSASYEDDDFIVTFDKNSRTFVRVPKAQAVEPSSPASPEAQVVYDPHTRSFVSKQENRRNEPGVTVTPIQPDRVASPTQRPRIGRSADSAEDRPLRPPPRNPARVSPDRGSPSSPRSRQHLQKQPSMVREDAEGEQEAEALSPVLKDSQNTPQFTQVGSIQVGPGPSKTYTAPTTPHERKASLDVPPATGSRSKVRNASISPQRSAHFSSSPISKPERHDPPPRSVSPFKSALKHSPASSIRTPSPMTNFSPLVAASTSAVNPSSEAFEGTLSQDGLDNSKKKKSARVSFDEQAQEVQVSNDSASAPGTVGSQEEDDDAVIKPRPPLPSFGSVRRNRMQPEMAEKVTEMPPERHEASSDHAIGGILRNSLQPLPPDVTSKEPAGYVSDESSDAEVPAVASAANPKPAEVGAGLDTNRDGSEPRVKDFATASTPAREQYASQEAENADVPAINLLPPTPGIEDESKRDLSDPENSLDSPTRSRRSVEILVPGGWGEEDDAEGMDTQTSTLSNFSSATPEQPSSSSEDGVGSLKPAESPVIHASPQQLSDIDEDTDDSAEFSDAVEDPSDLEDNGGGFASLDAIVESPMVSPSSLDTKVTSSTLMTREPPESPTAQRVGRNIEVVDQNTTTWGPTTAYWSQLSQERRDQIERQHMSSDDETKPTPVPNATKKPRMQKLVQNAGTTTLPTTRASRQAASTKQQESTEPTMRKTLRSGPVPRSNPTQPPVDDGVHMRRSMRSSGGTAPSLRSGPPPRRPQSEYIEPKSALQKKTTRPMSSSSAATSSSGSGAQSQRPFSASGPKPQDSAFPSLPTTKRTLQRRAEPPQASTRLQRELAKADESDSESSFRRRRRGNSESTMDSAGRFTMRRSMRGASVDQTPGSVEQRRPQSPDIPRSKSGFRIRSLSPPSFFGRNKAEASPPPVATRATLRSTPAAKATATKPAPSAPRYKSRFTSDSDDSDGDAAPGRSFFRSKFADSDDDEPESPAMPAGLTPVRGIPRRANQDDGDSTDLDSEDEVPGRGGSKAHKKVTPLAADPAEIERVMAIARRNVGVAEGSAPTPAPAAPAPAATTPAPKPKAEGTALARGSLRNKPEEPNQEQPIPTLRQEGPVVATPEKQKKRGFMGSILRRNRDSASSVQQVRTISPPPQSPALPATVVKASPPDTTQANVESPSSPSSPSVGKLIRRRSDQPRMARINSDYSIATAPPTSNATTAVATQNDEDWPLASPNGEIPPIPPIPPELAADAAARPTTSEGFSPEAVKLARTMRPDLAPRSKSGPQRSVRIQAGEEGLEPGEREKDANAIYSKRTGKKKKFGRLRRAFGIED